VSDTTPQAIKKKDLFRKYKTNLSFTVIEGEKVDFGKIFILKKKKIMIGRDRGNDIVLNDIKVSKHHCQIEIRPAEELGDEQIVITDLFSTNGTYLNGRVIDTARLKYGDKIDLGASILLFDQSDEVEKRYHSTLRDITTIDSLTGIYTRRYILTELENQKTLADRYRRPFSIVLLDIDDFKKINDTRGHPAGDEYLRHITSEIYNCLRENDKVGRVGGEEFLLILPETDSRGARSLADRIRRRIEESELAYKDIWIRSTVSAGVATYTDQSDSSANLYELADNALYRAKGQGKNRVVLASVTTR